LRDICDLLPIEGAAGVAAGRGAKMASRGTQLKYRSALDAIAVVYDYHACSRKTAQKPVSLMIQQ